MADLTLYHCAKTRSATILWLIEELGVPYDLVRIAVYSGESRKPEYLAINPMGKVPAIRHGDNVVADSAAIALYLAEQYPEAKLAPGLADSLRAAYLQWMVFRTGIMEPCITDKMKPRDGLSRGTLGWGDYETMVSVLSTALKKGPFLLGEQFSAADVVVGSGMAFVLTFDGLPHLPEFTSYVDRLEQRPARQRAIAIDKD